MTQRHRSGSQIPPEVVAAPTTVEVANIAPSTPSVVGFAAPAALALMLQHMAVTLTALSFVRERLSGAMEMLRISPVNSLELVLGKYLGLGVVSAVVAAISGVLLVTVLGVPMLGSAWAVAAVIALLVFASLGLGLIISVVSDSERQAVQLALLLLLASVFFSGFVLPVDQFREGVQLLRLPAAGHARHPPLAGHHAARRHDGVVADGSACAAGPYLLGADRDPVTAADEARLRGFTCARDARGSGFWARRSRCTA